MIPKNKEKNGWRIDFKFLIEIEDLIYSKYDLEVSAEEIESVILILIEKGELKNI